MPILRQDISNDIGGVMMDLWKKQGGKLVFVGTPEDFEKWREEWLDAVPKCRKFSCVHELMSCGIHMACGDCSIHDYQSREGCFAICNEVSCIDCVHRYDCDEAK